MKNLGSDLDVIVKLVKSSLPMFKINSSISLNSGGATLNSSPQPGNEAFQIYNGETRMVFVYGVSTYGGDDILIKPSRRRSVSNTYLFIKT